MIASKFPDIGTTIFTTMSQLAGEVGAVNLGQGFPDFDCDPRLTAYVNEAMQAGHNQYPPMTGVAALREAIADKVSALYGRSYHPANEITVTAGATQAIHTALAALVRPGDEVIVFEPVYDSYDPAIRMHGGVTVRSQLGFPDYRPDFDALKQLITARTRAIIVNSPHNPTATCWTRADMDALAALIAATDIVLLSDEVYEHMVFDGLKHQSLASHPALSERSIVISSFGKTYHVTGWKVAYVLAPAALMVEFRKAHQFVVFTVNTPMQHGIARYMAHGTHLDLPAFYAEKRDHFLRAVADVPLRWMPCGSTYFVSASYADLPGWSALSDQEFAQRLTREIGVACIPVSAFYQGGRDDKVVRFCFAKKVETLDKAAERLALLVRQELLDQKDRRHLI